MSAGQRVERQPAFVLHRRAYRESSFLLELFTRDFGRIAAVLRGARGAQRGYGASCQSFNPLLVSWSGRSDLKTLGAVERVGSSVDLPGQRLYSGFYINEILMRLLPPHDPHPQVFAAYLNLLPRLALVSDPEPELRSFELQVLRDLGYAPQFDRDALSGAVLEPEAQYVYQAESGFSQSTGAVASPLYPGWVLEAIGRADFSDPLTRRHAKRLLRDAISSLLGDRPLRSREFFTPAQPGSGR